MVSNISASFFSDMTAFEGNKCFVLLDLKLLFSNICLFLGEFV